MDPFGAVVSVLTVLEMVSKTVIYLQGVKNAPKERRELLDEVCRMKHRLDNLQLFVIDRDDVTSAAWRSDLESMESSEHTLEQCAKAIQRLNDKLYPIEKHGLAKWWQALTWNLTKGDVKTILEDIYHAETGIDRMLQKANTNQILWIRDGVQMLTINAENQEFNDMLEWICSVSYEKQLQDKLPKRREHTGNWFLHSAEYLDWARPAHGAILYCPGHQGCGKTVIASLVIKHLQEHLPTDHAVAFFYCDHRRQKDQNIVHFVLSIVRQLTAIRRSAQQQLTQLWENHEKGKTQLTEEEARHILRTSLALYKSVHIVIDALDEAQDHSPSVQKQLIDLAWKLREDHKVNFLITSRELPHLQGHFTVKSTFKPISADLTDIRVYLADRLDDFSLSIRKKPEIMQKAIASIVNVCDGMFLLARLLMDFYTDNAGTPRDLAEILNNVSASNYESAYHSAMERINGQPTRKRTLAIAALKWIVRARTLLSPSSLQCALTVQVGDQAFNPEGIPEIEDVLASCQGLLIIDERSDVIRLVHKTAHEYLQANHLTWLPGSDLLLAQTCLTYCLLQRQPDVQHAMHPMRRNMSHGLLFYAFRYCGEHAQDVDRSSDNNAIGALAHFTVQEFARATGLWAARQVVQARVDFSEIVPSPGGTTAWHFFARYDLSHLFETSTNGSQKTSQADDVGDTPLHYGIRFNATDTVRLILCKSCCEFDSKNIYGRTPLSEAAASGDSHTINSLLQLGGSVDIQDNDGSTPLARAVHHGHFPAVTLLLEAGSKPNVLDLEMRPPLLYSTDSDISEALLRFGALPTAIDSEGNNALHLAMQQYPEGEASKKQILRLTGLLLDYGVDVNGKDDHRRTPLHRAVEFGQFDVAILMLGRNADTTLEDGRHETFLTRALAHGRYWPSRAKLLLSALRKTSKNVPQEVHDCYERLVRRATRAWIRMREMEKSDVDVGLTGAKLLKGEIQVIEIPSSSRTMRAYTGSARRFEMALSGCLLLEHFASDIIKEPQTIGGILAREHDNSTFFTSGRRAATCVLCKKFERAHGLRCFDSCSKDVEFDICDECVAGGKWCHDKAHRLQKFCVGQMCLDESKPWQEYQYPRPRAVET